jgi:glutaredoxin 2
VVPILEINHGTHNEIMKESMDIVRRIDEDPAYGAQLLKVPVCSAMARLIDVLLPLQPASGRADLAAWENASADTMRRLLRPRHVRAPLPEFAFKKVSRG